MVVLQKFPPTAGPSNRMVHWVNSRSENYRIRPLERFVGNPVGMIKSWWEGEEK